MNKYLEDIYKWIDCDYIKRELGNQGIDIHIDQLNGKMSKFVEYIDEGLIYFKNLIDFARENNLLEDFIPTFTIDLLRDNKLEDIKINSKKDILKYVDKSIPPEIKLVRKIEKTMNYANTYIQKCLSNTIFNVDDDEENYYTYLYTYINNYDLVDECMVYREIEFVYNENNSKIVKDVDKMILKK